MKYVLLSSIVILFLNNNNCVKQNYKTVNLCLDKKDKGWFYVFISDNQTKKNIGKCFSFDKKNILILASNSLNDSTKFNLYKEDKLINDSAYFFSLNEYDTNDKNNLKIKYFSFFINDTLPPVIINSEMFKYKEFKEFEFNIEQNIIDYKLTPARSTSNVH